MSTNDYVSYMTPTTHNYGVGSGMERQQSNDAEDYSIYGSAQVQCRKCNEYNDQSEIQCKSCQEFLTQYEYDDNGDVM